MAGSVRGRTGGSPEPPSNVARATVRLSSALPILIAAEPVLDPAELGRLLGARPVPVSPRVARTLADVSWRLRLQPTPAGWLDMALGVPLMDTTRARRELGWEPTATAGDALLELIDAMRRGDGLPTAPLEPGGAGPLRVRELLSGIGGRSI